MSSTDHHTFERAARFLESSGDYRVLRKLRPVTGFHAPIPDAEYRVGVAIDVETTGLDSSTDRIIELAVQRFRYDLAGRIVEVGQPRVWREDPERALDPVITRLTGLTDDMLKGQVIDDEMALEILTSADLIVAHNAGFDRPFVDKRLPGVAGKAWACSLTEPDWLDLGFDG
ncbi:exonuclease domain-containing protein [Novosphingobium olei]|uniref:exonuclease domain-containing protein n=1 Tax=Novosphingobium olei TaxID=2728851 RepID=UPI001F106092|nr:exonuclease domain-containing protein [Novosphingobium olei]